MALEMVAKLEDEKSMAGGIVRRGKRGGWSYRLVVPGRYKSVEPRKELWISLKTDGEAEARVRAAVAERDALSELEARLVGASPSATSAERFKATAARAQALGVSYMTAAELAASNLGEILARVDRAREVDPDASNAVVVSALLGGTEKPSLLLSQLVIAVEALSEQDHRFKNAKQMKRWRDERNRAVANLQSALGGDDIEVLAIDAAIAKKHQLWAEKGVKAKQLGLESANKHFQYISAMVARYRNSLEAQQVAVKPYAGISIAIKHTEIKKRKSIGPKLIIEHIIHDSLNGSLSGLNDEARDIAIICSETGARASEIYNVAEEDIFFEHELPHIWIRNSSGEAAEDEQDFGDGAKKDQRREIKSADSKRQLPLTGASLEAMRRHPKGFARTVMEPITLPQ